MKRMQQISIYTLRNAPLGVWHLNRQFRRRIFKQIKGIMLFVIFPIIISCSENRNNQSNLSKEIELTDIIFKNKIYDFGKVSNDTILSAKYYFKNIGTNNLIIEYVNPDCICTDYFLSKDTIIPKTQLT